MITLTCADCRTPKLAGEFTPSQQVKSSSRCKSCISARNRKHRAENGAAIKTQRAGYYRANRETILQASKDLRAKRGHLYEPARQEWAKANRDKMLGYYRDRGHQFREWVDSLKADTPCMDCGEQYPPFVMEYDHVRGTKRHNIGKMANHKRARVLEEIAKCDLVCCVCHRIRSHARRRPATTPKLVSFRAWINVLKDCPCVDCGETHPPEAMDFDHIRGTKMASITDMWSWARDKVQVELGKCELACANCHRIRTVENLHAEIEEAA